MQTSQAASARLPIISDMLKAIERIKAEGPMPPNEIKLHPDDYAELRRQIKPSLRYQMDRSISVFSGVNIAIDLSAERLPRKMNSNG